MLGLRLEVSLPHLIAFFLFLFFFSTQSKSTFAAEHDSGIQEVGLWHKVSPNGHVAQLGAPLALVTPGQLGGEGQCSSCWQLGELSGALESLRCEDWSNTPCW